MRLVIVVLAVLVVSVVPEGVPPVFTDQFVVQVEGGPEVAKDLAKKHGFTYHAQVSDFFFFFSELFIRPDRITSSTLGQITLSSRLLLSA